MVSVIVSLRRPGLLGKGAFGIFFLLHVNIEERTSVKFSRFGVVWKKKTNHFRALVSRDTVIRGPVSETKFERFSFTSGPRLNRIKLHINT